MDLTQKIVGIDIGRSSISCCVLRSEPEDLKQFAENYKPITLEPDADGVKRLLELGDVFIMEPTGADYWLWSEALEAAQKPYWFVSGIRIRNFARTHDIMSKGDSEDAAVIACYGLIHLQRGRKKAFLEVPRTQLREHWLTLRSMPKLATNIKNKLRSRLVFEAPHLRDATASDRAWANEQASKLWRDLAGVESSSGRKRVEPEFVVGRSLSWVTTELAQLVCQVEAFQGKLESAIECEIEQDTSLSMKTFKAVFESWGIGDRTGAAIISACHPIEQFLSEDGRRIRSRKWNTHGTRRNGRDKSLKAFQRAMAFGQVKIQSGQKMVLVPTGDRYVRDAILNFLVAKIVMQRQPSGLRLHKLYGKPDGWDEWKKKQRDEWKQQHSFESIHAGYGDCPWNSEKAIAAVMQYNGASDPFARLQLFYQFAPQCQNLTKFKRVKKVYSKFVRMLFKDLVNAYQALKESRTD